MSNSILINGKILIEKRKSFARKFNNYFWIIFLFGGGNSFLSLGFYSFYNRNNLLELTFIPQGMFLLFYGTLAVIFAIFLALIVLLNVGEETYEYNQNERLIHITKFGFPKFNLKRRSFCQHYTFDEIEKVEIHEISNTTESSDRYRGLFLCLKNGKLITIDEENNFFNQFNIESNDLSVYSKRGSLIAKILGVNLLYIIDTDRSVQQQKV